MGADRSGLNPSEDPPTGASGGGIHSSVVGFILLDQGGHPIEFSGDDMGSAVVAVPSLVDFQIGAAGWASVEIGNSGGGGRAAANERPVFSKFSGSPRISEEVLAVVTFGNINHPGMDANRDGDEERVELHLDRDEVEEFEIVEFIDEFLLPVLGDPISMCCKQAVRLEGTEFFGGPIFPRPLGLGEDAESPCSEFVPIERGHLAMESFHLRAVFRIQQGGEFRTRFLDVLGEEWGALMATG